MQSPLLAFFRIDKDVVALYPPITQLMPDAPLQQTAYGRRARAYIYCRIPCPIQHPTQRFTLPYQCNNATPSITSPTQPHHNAIPTPLPDAPPLPPPKHLRARPGPLRPLDPHRHRDVRPERTRRQLRDLLARRPAQHGLLHDPRDQQLLHHDLAAAQQADRVRDVHAPRVFWRLAVRVCVQVPGWRANELFCVYPGARVYVSVPDVSGSCP
ncbi:hypothetical protein BJ546DRAFT_528457 [Cryomyces antarcticus]